MARFLFDGRYGFGGSRESGIWWVRFNDRLLQLKAPRYEPLFSERYGFYGFRWSWGGWRLMGKQSERKNQRQADSSARVHLTRFE